MPATMYEDIKLMHQESLTIATMLDLSDVERVVRLALDEDLGGDPGRDVTTQSTIDAEQETVAHVVARKTGVIAGLDIFPIVLTDVARRLQLPVPTVVMKTSDGSKVAAGAVLMEIKGRTQVILMAERVSLNIVCRMSGVATHTHRWVEALTGTGALVLDTRKTTPGLRSLEKYAVRCGGGTNKRMGLYDVAMIKDNHKLAAGSITAAFSKVRAAYPDVDIQVEVETPAEAAEAVRAGARFLLCDNMSVDELRESVLAARSATEEAVELEATGGLTLDMANAYGRSGVDYLSVGGLTHSSPILDIAVDLA